MNGDDIKLKEVFSPKYEGRTPVVRFWLDHKTVSKYTGWKQLVQVDLNAARRISVGALENFLLPLNDKALEGLEQYWLLNKNSVIMNN